MMFLKKNGLPVTKIVKRMSSPAVILQRRICGCRSFAMAINAIALSLAVMMALPTAVLAVQLANCELPDGDIDGDECITQNIPKNNGDDNCDTNCRATFAGNPINVATGNKFESGSITKAPVRLR